MDEKNIKKVLLTGITGSGGSYLAEYIVQNHPHIEVHGTIRWRSTSSKRNIAHILDRVKLHECDLNDFGAVLKVIQTVRPDAVFHFADYSNVPASFTNPQAALSNNILGTSILLEAIRLAEENPLFQLCSTSEVYGQVLPEEIPIKEDTVMRPVSPYAISKAAQDMLGLAYFRSYNMRIVRTRMFTYLNPRRPDLFSTSFARQIARIEAGLQKELLHGNLECVRTVLDVRDAMEAYWAAVLRGAPGEAYNMGSDEPVSVGDFLDLLKSYSKISIPMRFDPALRRPADVPILVPDLHKFRASTGWEPKYSLEESVPNLLNYWRERVHNEELCVPSGGKISSIKEDYFSDELDD